MELTVSAIIFMAIVWVLIVGTVVAAMKVLLSQDKKKK